MSQAIRYLAKLRDTQTDLVYHVEKTWRVDVTDKNDDREPLHYITFLWEEGNYSCDCNRAIFCLDDEEGYKRDEDGMIDYPCGDTRFELLDIILI